ncbi:MAG TPA: hypothetical protein VL283_01855 [Candidatus Baltobacteraceae bacterium]|nr:hypothetical protein [Candidatus Baltobacteraceae bacterium]
MPDFEKPLADVENPEKRRYEYKDAEGKKIADVEAEFLTVGEMIEDPASGGVVAARKLLSLKLVNPDDGRVFDVLAAFNGKGADIIVPERRIANYSHGVLGTEAIVPAPESPVDLATMLHELGHVDQLDDPETQGFSGFAGISKAFMVKGGMRALGLDDVERITTAKGHMTAVFAAIPEAREAADPEAVAALEAASTMEELETAAARLKDILALPLRMAERDATRRALQNLRRVREESGIDLLSKTLNPKEALVSPAEGCEAATIEGLEDPDRYVAVSTVAAMKGDLKTYGAGTSRIRK